MKKFLFTLAALLMMTSAFAQTDANYLYVNTALTEQANDDPEAWGLADGEMVFVISADIPAYMSAFEVWVDVPEGITYTMWECGADGAITYWNARHAQQTLTPTPTTSQAGPQHSLLAIQTEGYYQIDGVWTKVGAVKWAPGHYDEFMLLFATYTEDYHGGIINIDTAPSSGADPRGQTVNDLGDMGVHHVTPPTEPLPDPNPVVVAPAAPVITFAGEETTEMTVTVTAEEGCTLIVNGEGILSNTYSYTVTRDDIYTPGTVNVTAKAVKDGVESDEATGSKAFIVADFPTADQPVINFVETKNDNDEVVSVEVVVTNATSYTITVDGVETDATVINANYTADQAIFVYAVNAPGYPYEENFNEADYNLNKLAKKAVADPVISTSMDDNNVYVTIAWPAETDGNQIYTGEYTYARPEYGQPAESYDVEAYVEEGSEWLPSGVTTATIPVPAKDPVWQDVAAPVITTDVQEDKVVVTIEWPTSTGNRVYTGEYEYARPEYGQPDESYNVEAYVEADYPYAESTHATETIEVPAKGAQWVDGTAPVIEFIPTKDGNIVTEVEVVVTGADTYTIKVNGEALRGEKIAASYDEVKNIHVDAVKNANYPYMEATAEGNYTLNKLVAAPVITTDVYEDKVFVNITWPTTDGNNVYTGEYTYDRGEADQSFNVEAYTAAAGEYQESFHATATIEVPALEQTPDQTADPVITTTTGKYNEGYINITCADENAIIYYRYQLDDGEWTEWTEYEGPVMLVENGHYNIEAKAQDPEKEMSNVVEGELTVSDCTAVYEVTTGKAIANVRYFNLAGQEMQEANGMTIIVTTYTDGTTSAVKVMK